MATQQQQHHYTPPWLDWIATNVVPSAMILAELIIVTGFFIVTSVRHPYEPQSWSYLEWALVVVAGFVGLAMAGLALKLSGQAAEMLATGHYVRGAFTFVGVLVLACIETWAGIVERAQTIGIGPADVLLADYTHIDAFKHIPTSVFMVAFILPCLVLWYGWASRPPMVISAEEQAATHARKLADARFKAEKRALQARGWGTAIGGGFKAAKAQVTGDDTHGLDDGIPTGSGDGNHEVTGGDTAMFDSAPGQAGYGMKAPVSIKRGSWTSRQLKDYARETYGVDVSDIEAANTMKVLSKGRKSGAAYVASSRVVKAWVDERYSTGSGDAEPTGTSPR